MIDTLDLDALSPINKAIKLNGVSYECNPITIQQLINLGRLEENLSKINSLDEIMPMVLEAISPFIPSFKTEKIDITIQQLRAIIVFAQKSSVPDLASEAKQYAPKKKDDSVKESQDSVVSTPPTE